MPLKHTLAITHVNLSRNFRGGEQQTLLLVKGLADYPVKQTLIVRSNSELHYRASEAGINVIALKKPFILSLWQARGDLLHAHEAKAAHWCHLAKKIRRVPYIITRRVPHRPHKNAFTASVYQNALCTISLSRAITQVLHSYAPQLPVMRIPSMYTPSVADNETVNQLKKRYRGKYVIGQVAALVSHHKGQNYLLEAARLLVSKYPHMQFVFVGDGKDRKKLQCQAQNIDQVEFVGFRADVENYLAIFDVFAFPSLHEGLGSSLLNAMRNSLPIVASAVDGIPDIIQHDVNGLLVASKSARELANAIERIYKSPALATKLAHRAYLDSKRYSVETISRQIFSLYSSALRQRY